MGFLNQISHHAATASLFPFYLDSAKKSEGIFGMHSLPGMSCKYFTCSCSQDSTGRNFAYNSFHYGPVSLLGTSGDKVLLGLATHVLGCFEKIEKKNKIASPFTCHRTASLLLRGSLELFLRVLSVLVRRRF